jgi:hypothetical protein
MGFLNIPGLFYGGLDAIRAVGKGDGKFGIINSSHYHAIEWRDGEL